MRWLILFLRGHMARFALRRLLISVPLVFVMTFVMFVVVNWQGTSRFDTFENDSSVDPQIIEMEKRRLGIYDPVPLRYLYWLRGVCFDVRVTPERRFVATFEDNDPARGDDKYRFGGTEVLREMEGVGGEYELKGPEGAPLGALGAEDGVRRLLEPRDVERFVVTVEGEAPEGLTLGVVTGTEELSVPFERAEGKPVSVSIIVDDLARQAAIPEIRRIRLVSAKPGIVRVKAESMKRRVWQETYPGRAKKRAIQMTFSGAPGEFAQLGMLKSPYTTSEVDGWTWNADWAAVRAKVDEKNRKAREKWVADGSKGEEPEPIVVQEVNFDRLEFEARSFGNAALPVTLWLLHGPQATPNATRVAELRLGIEEETFAVDLAGLPAEVDRRQIRGIRVVSDVAGRCEFDDFRLRIAGNPFRIGWPNFGTSWDKKKGVVDLIGEKVKNTILLNVFALIFVWLISLPIGIYGAVRQHSQGERVVSFLTFIGMSMPSFFLAILLVFLVSLTYEIPKESGFRWLRELLPIAGRTSQGHSEMRILDQMVDVAKHMILPVAVGVLGGVGGLQRILRGTMLEERRKLYITTAMAKGLPGWKVLYKHALRNAIIPFVASSGSILPGMMAGSAFTEIVFDYPGIGRQMLESVLSYDVPVVMANLLIAGLLLVIGNLLADIGLGLVDPRISVDA